MRTNPIWLEEIQKLRREYAKKELDAKAVGCGRCKGKHWTSDCKHATHPDEFFEEFSDLVVELNSHARVAEREEKFRTWKMDEAEEMDAADMQDELKKSLPWRIYLQKQKSKRPRTKLEATPDVLGQIVPRYVFSNFYSNFRAKFRLIFGPTLRGSFSAVSKLNFARKYSLESSRRDLHSAL